MTRILSLILLLTASVQVYPSPDESKDDFFRKLVAKSYVEPFRSGDVEGWIKAFDKQAIAMHNRRPMDRGVAAIEAFGRAVHTHFELQEYEVEVTDVRHSPDWVYTAGSFTTLFVTRDDGSEPFGREQGKFLLLWARQDDGSWKVILDMGNSNQ
jgi:ketosteroid isomerase-like protein